MSSHESDFCEHFITHEDLGSSDPWAGTYCKLQAGHAGPHSALYADEFQPGRMRGTEPGGPRMTRGRAE
jgi:hypothetical protein